MIQAGDELEKGVGEGGPGRGPLEEYPRSRRQRVLLRSREREKRAPVVVDSEVIVIV